MQHLSFLAKRLGPQMALRFLTPNDKITWRRSLPRQRNRQHLVKQKRTQTATTAKWRHAKFMTLTPRVFHATQRNFYGRTRTRTTTTTSDDGLVINQAPEIGITRSLGWNALETQTIPKIRDFSWGLRELMACDGEKLCRCSKQFEEFV